MKILAIDPGYDRIGIALVSGEATKPILIHSECFVTSRSDKHEIRLSSIALKIERIIKDFKPDRLAIETLFFSVNQKTAIAVSEGRGVIMSEAGKKNIPVEEINPNSVKVAVTGYGASKKEGVISMVKKLISIDKEIKYDDEYDAIAIGITSLCNPPKNLK